MGYFCVSLYSLQLIIKNNKVASLMSRYRRQTVRDHKQYFSYIVEISSTGGGNQSTSKKPLTCPKPLINFSCSNHWLHMFCAVLKELHEFGSLYFIKDNITCQSYMTFIRQFVYGTYSSKMPNLIVFGQTRPGLDPTIYRTYGEHANNYATDAVATRMCFLVGSILSLSKNCSVGMGYLCVSLYSLKL
jgi:hypothetical protein